jgi:uncharacterized protein
MPSSAPPTLSGLDAGIARDVASIQAVDQHAHPVAVGVELAGDPERPIQPYDVRLPLRMRPANDEYLDAWADLWGYEERDWSTSKLASVVDKKEATIAEKGDGYNVWVLDRLNIQTQIGIAPGPNPSLPPPRFRWCAFSDWFLWPFPVRGAELSSMQHAYRRTNDDFTQRWCPSAPPPTVAAYLSDVALATLLLYREQGAVGIKFHGPYNRSLSFDEVSSADAETLYARGLREGALPSAEHKALQDFVFEQLVTLAGQHDLVVQIHTGYGVRDRFPLAGSNPVLMERVFHAVSETAFVLLHGGWPFVTETVALLANDNVYTDFSCASLFQYPRSLSGQIRAALEWYPEKLLFGTDAYSERSLALLGGLPFLPNPLGGWEEKAWLMNRTGRTALALALSGMHADAEVDATRVAELARMVMGETAASIYRLED